MYEYGKDGAVALVVGVDGSDTSLHALAFAIGAARRQQARLLVEYVCPYPGGGLDPTGILSSRIWDSADELGDWLRTTAAQASRELHVPIDVRVSYGDPCTRLLETADGERADQIIVGASVGVAHRVIGALGVRLQRRSPAPVTIVP